MDPFILTLPGVMAAALHADLDDPDLASATLVFDPLPIWPARAQAP